MPIPTVDRCLSTIHDASGLKQQSVATQQGYLLQAIDTNLQDIVARQMTSKMPIFGPAGCLEILEAEFKSLYPIFNRRVDFFQVRKDQGESAEEFWRRLSKLGDMADLESMSREDLTAFRFIDACDDKRLREKIFDLKRKDATAIKEVIAQYDRQQKAEAALRAKAPIAAVKSKKNDQRSTYNPDQGIECSSCGGRHLQRDCRVFKERMICNYCGRTGHLSRMCFSRQGKPGPARGNRQIRAVTDEEPVPQDSWVNRLNLKISHPHGSFTFHNFPDTGSTATLIAADLARKNNIRPTLPCLTKYVNVCGDPVSTKGTALITLHTSTSSTSSNVVITPATKNKIIIGRDDLKKLGLIPK